MSSENVRTLILWSKFDDFELPMTTNFAFEGSFKTLNA